MLERLFIVKICLFFIDCKFLESEPPFCYTVPWNCHLHGGIFIRQICTHIELTCLIISSELHIFTKRWVSNVLLFNLPSRIEIKGLHIRNDTEVSGLRKQNQCPLPFGLAETVLIAKSVVTEVGKCTPKSSSRVPILLSLSYLINKKIFGWRRKTKMKCIIIFQQYLMKEGILRTVITPLFPPKGLFQSRIEVLEHCSGNKFLAAWSSENWLHIYVSLLAMVWSRL